MTLTEAPLGASLTVVETGLDQETCLRLSELGLRPGHATRVLQRSTLAGTVLALGGHRLALDTATARAVRVSLTGPLAP